MALNDFTHFGRTRIEGKTRPGKQGNTHIALGQFAAGKKNLALTGFREKQLCGVSGVVPAQKNTGLIAFEKKDHRQEYVIDTIQRAPDDLARQARTKRRTGKQ